MTACLGLSVMQAVGLFFGVIGAAIVVATLVVMFVDWRGYL